jgi:hypothetical protein
MSDGDIMPTLTGEPAMVVRNDGQMRVTAPKAARDGDLARRGVMPTSVDGIGDGDVATIRLRVVVVSRSHV